MIFGIGTDIVRVARIEAALGRYGLRFAMRVLSAAEYDTFAGQRHPARYVAKRFAAKEAAAKALGTGLGGALGLRDVEVAHDGRGKPLLQFSAAGERLCRELGVGAAHLSLADEAEYAVAYVALEKA